MSDRTNMSREVASWRPVFDARLREELAREHRATDARAREVATAGMPTNGARLIEDAIGRLQRPAQRTGGVTTFSNDERGPAVPGSIRWQWKGRTIVSRAIGVDPMSEWQGTRRRKYSRIRVSRGATDLDARAHGPTLGIPERDADVASVRAPVGAKVREAEYRWKGTEHPGTMAMAAAAARQRGE